jgi:molecular chaperone GrpE
MAREPDIVEAVNGPQTTTPEEGPARPPAGGAGGPQSAGQAGRSKERAAADGGEHRGSAASTPQGGRAASTGQPADVQPSMAAGDPEAPVGPGVGEPETVSGPHIHQEPPHGRDGDSETEDHERQLEHDLEELTARAEKADEYLELAQRTKADFENYRKRAAREAAAAQERGVAKLAKELLPAVDNLDRALEAAQSAIATGPGSQGQSPQDNGTATLVSGIKLVHEDVIAALARAGIERFSPEGERFDPQQHEAIAQQPVEGAESGTVVEVYQSGYRLGDVVIRPARVVVAA